MTKNNVIEINFMERGSDTQTEEIFVSHIEERGEHAYTLIQQGDETIFLKADKLDWLINELQEAK